MIHKHRITREFIAALLYERDIPAMRVTGIPEDSTIVDMWWNGDLLEVIVSYEGPYREVTYKETT